MVLYCLSGWVGVCVCVEGGGMADGVAGWWFKVNHEKNSVCTITTKSNEIYFQYGLYTRHDHQIFHPL